MPRKLEFRISFPENVDQMVLALRWLALALVIVLSFFDPFTAGILIAPSSVILAFAIYNLLGHTLGHYITWFQRPLNLLALDILMTTGAIYLTGGFHSSFFIMYYFIIAGLAFYLNMVQTLLVALLLNIAYIVICFLNPASRQFPYAIYSVLITSAALPLLAVLCALFLEQVRREQEKAERERTLAARLTALNELFQQLSTSLNLEQVLQTIVSASCRLLGADVALISLLEKDGRTLRPAAARGIDIGSLADERWTTDDALVTEMLALGRPYIFDNDWLRNHPLPSEQFQTVLALMKQKGIVSGVSVPLLLNGEAIGFLDVGHREPQRYTEEDVAFLSALGQEAAIAVRNARLYEAEKRQVERLQALERLQASFISAVSHELRTPLTILRTSLDLLQAQMDSCPSETRRELLETINHHAERLEALVSDLLEVTRLEAGQVTLVRQPTDLRRIVERVVQSFAPLLQNRRQSIALDLPPHLPPVFVDRRRMEQVLNNLLSNAHKFTPKGGHIRVTVQEKGDVVEVRVQDNGPGIPPEEQERIFDKFYVVTDGHRQAGVGLGLYIARQFVALHGGRIWVESQPGAGSTFCFTVPIDTPAEQRKL